MRKGYDPQNDRRRKMRGVIIHELCLIGYVLPNGDPDIQGINKVVMGLGSNKRGVILNFLYYDELPAVVSQVKAMCKEESKKMRK